MSSTTTARTPRSWSVSYTHLDVYKRQVNTITLLESGKLAYIISTSAKGRNPARDSVKIRRKAALLGIPCLTAIDTANALADSLMSRYKMCIRDRRISARSATGPQICKTRGHRA